MSHKKDARLIWVKDTLDTNCKGRTVTKVHQRQEPVNCAGFLTFRSIADGANRSLPKGSLLVFDAVKLILQVFIVL